MPPLKTIEYSSVPPDNMFTVPPEIVVPELTNPLATPPEETFSTPPAYIVTSLVIVPATFSKPPLETKILSTLPPDETFSLPPLETVADSNKPLDFTLTVPPALIVVPVAAPPALAIINATAA